MTSDHTFCSSCRCNCIQEAKPCECCCSCLLAGYRGRRTFCHSSKVTL